MVELANIVNLVLSAGVGVIGITEQSWFVDDAGMMATSSSS